MAEETEKEKKRWDVTRAIEEAAKLGVFFTRPTVIRMCEIQGCGYQPTGIGGHWVIDAEKFKALVKGESKK